MTDVEKDKDEINGNVSITHNEFQPHVEAQLLLVKKDAIWEIALM